MQDCLESEIDWYLVYLAIARAIEEKKSFLISRIGHSEARCLAHTQEVKNPPKQNLEMLWHSSGVYPAEPGEFAKFASSYIMAMNSIDILAIMRTGHEKKVVDQHINNVLKCSLISIEPYLHPRPWSMHLKGLDVLVVTPFCDSIKQNYYSNRANLFLDQRVLPEFQIKTVRSPQGLCHNKTGFASWSDGLAYLKNEVDMIQYDVAILGCGAYGLPLGAHIKEKGKVAIHLGGVTQLLFGVRGKRWDDAPLYQGLFNSHWVRPTKNERPTGWEKMEGGCYW
jgi:hypothetical protein